MFCLFKNSRIAYPLNWLVWLASLGGTLYWLYFAFIEKAFLQKVFAGQALFVDLLLGLPVVLVFALVVYAMIFWGLKVLIILFWSDKIIQLPSDASELSDELDPALEDGYWEQEASESNGSQKNAPADVDSEELKSASDSDKPTSHDK
ncbi:MAG: hypothetical protein AB7C96_02915 [Hydrogenovibrio sp.]